MSDKIKQIDGLLPPLEPGNRFLQPSALGRFISYEQCQRLFRLDLYRRDTRDRLYAATGARPELLPPSFSESGRSWEASVEEALRNAGWLVSDLTDYPNPGLALNVMITEPGQQRIVLQSALGGVLAGWEIDAKPDLVLIDKTGTRLRLLIADLKSSRAVRLEHRLQVALYAMVAAAHFDDAEIVQGVLYREPIAPIEQWSDEEQAHKAAARDFLNLDSGALLAIADRPELYEEQVERAVLRPESLANRIAAQPFSELPFHLSAKCDGCQYNELCLCCAREANDLSLIPYMTERNKRLLRGAGIRTVEQLRTVRESSPASHEALGVTPGIGPKLAGLMRRAESFAQWQSGAKVDTRLPEQGYSSLPATSPDHHANLIRVYLDVQRDPTQGRVYLLGALVSCLRDGSEQSARERTVVKIAQNPVVNDQQEADLVIAWIRDVLFAVHSCRWPDAAGNDSAPIHFYVWDGAQIGVLQNLVNRQHGAVLGIEAIMALIMQPAALDSSNLSIIAEEIEDQRALPMLCQSLHSVASYFGYQWPPDIRDQFSYRVFDSLRRASDDEAAQLVPTRSRFRSEIPIEYAYKAWRADDTFAPDDPDEEDRSANSWSLYSAPSLDQIQALQTHRLAAIKLVAGNLRTNRQTTKSPFNLADLQRYAVRKETPIESVREFLAVERHLELSEWRRTCSLSRETRVKMGATLVARYDDEAQFPEVRLKMRSARERQAAWDALPQEQRDSMEKDERKAYRYDLGGLELQLRLDPDDLKIPVSEALLLTQRREGDFVVVAPAESVDSRQDPADRVPFQTTARQIMRLHGRGHLTKLTSDGLLVVTLKSGGGTNNGFTWAPSPKPLDEGALVTVDADPDSWPMSRQWTVIERIRGGVATAGSDWLCSDLRPLPTWSEREAAAQARFMDGLLRFESFRSVPRRYEDRKREFIGQGGQQAMTLVQGPPGTGKSTTTGLAIWARIQGALAGGREYRVAVGCKTHAATNVLVPSILEAKEALRAMASQRPNEFDEFFDRRLLTVPVFRFDPSKPEEVPSGVRDFERRTSSGRLNEARKFDQVILGATTNGLGKVAADAWKDGNLVWDLLVLDEASQMSVPEFLVASIGLKRDGRLIVVGDHRQMPPIVRQNREENEIEPLDPYAMYRSVFDVVRFDTRPRADIKFSESFRIHRDVAEYLRREVYSQDGIDFHSRRAETLAGGEGDSFAGAVLAAPHPLILVVHSEQGSQQRNLVEQDLTQRILYALDQIGGEKPAGVVVPHRAQRADLQKKILQYTGNEALAKSVDTVERFQGDERQVIIYNATESDPAYLRDTASFLFDPRRLTVAISRAQLKLIVIASEAVFDFLPNDDTTLKDSAIWRNLRERACTIPVWSGEIEGYQVSVWGNPPLAPDRQFVE
jgi:predicted RecB family nuclease